jgi:hypothetical protein
MIRTSYLYRVTAIPRIPVRGSVKPREVTPQPVDLSSGKGNYFCSWHDYLGHTLGFLIRGDIRKFCCKLTIYKAYYDL